MNGVLRMRGNEKCVGIIIIGEPFFGDVDGLAYLYQGGPMMVGLMQ